MPECKFLTAPTLYASLLQLPESLVLHLFIISEPVLVNSSLDLVKVQIIDNFGKFQYTNSCTIVLHRIEIHDV